MHWPNPSAPPHSVCPHLTLTEYRAPPHHIHPVAAHRTEYRRTAAVSACRPLIWRTALLPSISLHPSQSDANLASSHHQQQTSGAAQDVSPTAMRERGGDRQTTH